MCLLYAHLRFMLPLFARQVKYFLASVEENEWRMHTEVSIEIYSNDIFWKKWEIFYTYRMIKKIWWFATLQSYKNNY